MNYPFVDLGVIYTSLYEAPGDLLAKFKQTQYLKSD